MNDKPEKMPPVPPFVRFVASAVPMVFDNNSLSYYEALCALWKYIQSMTDVINNNATLEDEFIEKVNDLELYMNNYFDNLDVQEEINAKLDAMAEAGTLADIISQYLNSIAIFGYDTVASMKSATNLVDGSYARTLGYHTKNDNGGALYKVRTIINDDVVDERKIIELADDTLIAELIVPSVVTPEVVGAYGDGTHDDTDAIQYSINNFPATRLSDKTYKITQPLTINSSNKSLIGVGKASILSYLGSVSSDYLIKISKEAKKFELGNLQLVGNGNINGLVNGYETDITVSNRSHIHDLYITNITNGIVTYCYGSNFNNILIDTASEDGMKVLGTDHFFSDMRIYRANGYGISCTQPSNRFNNVKCAVCNVGFYFKTDNIDANIESQENYQDNIILDSVVTSNFIINSNGASCVETEDINGTSNGDYGLLNMRYCREVNVTGSVYAHPTFLERKGLEKYALKMTKTNINNNVNLTFQNRDTSMERTIPSLIQSDAFNDIKINCLDAELYNTAKIASPTISGTSRTTLSNVTPTSATLTIVSIPASNETPVFSTPMQATYDYVSIGFQMSKPIMTGYVQYQYEADGSTHSFNLPQSERRLAYDSNDFNKILFSYEGLQAFLMTNATYASYVNGGYSITNRKIMIILNLSNYQANDTFNIQNFKVIAG